MGGFKEEFIIKTLIIDNYDSYTYNIFQIVATMNQVMPVVIRNDQFDWSTLQAISFDNVIISPGPGRPENAKDVGLSADVMLNTKVPIFGVCLGHQLLAHVYGGSVIHAPEIFHGRLSEIYHDESSLFSQIPQGFEVVRYHSLIVDNKLPPILEKTAWTKDGIIMGLQHKLRPIWGVQFHPESICTEFGSALFRNFHDLTLEYYKNSYRTHIPKIEAESFAVSRSTSKKFEEDPSITLESYRILYKELDTNYNPEEVFLNHMSEQDYAFWLDSSKIETGMSRFSYIGSNSGPLSKVIRYRIADQQVEVLTNDGSTFVDYTIFDYLEKELSVLKCQSDLPFDFNCGFVGYFGYELKEECGGKKEHDSNIHDVMFILSDRIIAFDHLEGKTYLVTYAHKDNKQAAEAWLNDFEGLLGSSAMRDLNFPEYLDRPIPFYLGRSHAEYIADLEQLKGYLIDGESYEVNLTNRIHTIPIEDPLRTYRCLRKVNPAPYSAYIRFKEIAILCSSPERFLQISSNNNVEAKPIKGTLKRGRTLEEDKNLKLKLKNSAKDFSENLMIVDLLRNDLGAVCVVGSVHVTKLMEVESFETVHQLVSTIKGKLKEDVSTIDCIKGSFPAGSMTGAPKIRTMDIIDKLEKESRGIYSGALGFLSLNGSADLNVVIRTIVCTPNITTIGVGGGITIQSDAEQEYDEMLLKASALIKSIVKSINGDDKLDYYEIVGDRNPSNNKKVVMI